VEGVVCGLLDGLDALRDSGVPVDDEANLLLIGGGARAHAFQRVFADLSGRPVRVPRGEHVAAGACVQAAATLTERAPEEVAAAWGLGQQGHVIEPDPAVDADGIRAAFTRARDIAGRT
jgi:xylulokinase